MTFMVKVLLRKMVTGGRLHHAPLAHMNFSLRGDEAPGKRISEARAKFNGSKHYHGKDLLSCVSTSYSAGEITLYVQSVREVEAQEEATRLAVGGAPKRHIPRSRHHS